MALLQPEAFQCFLMTIRKKPLQGNFKNGEVPQRKVPLTQHLLTLMGPAEPLYSRGRWKTLYLFVCYVKQWQERGGGKWAIEFLRSVWDEDTGQDCRSVRSTSSRCSLQLFRLYSVFIFHSNLSFIISCTSFQLIYIILLKENHLFDRKTTDFLNNEGLAPFEGFSSGLCAAE